MSKLIITRGLPGSGKTTWAKDFIAWEPKFRKRVNRDDLRAMLHGGFDRELENQVTKVQHGLVADQLRAGNTVVVDDTNLRLRVARDFHKLAVSAGATFEVNDSFLSVPVEECIRRDALRDPVTRVGAAVINRMHTQYQLAKGLEYPSLSPADLAGQRQAYFPDESLPAAIICDIDGTLAAMNGRGPHDYHLVGGDTPREAVINAVHAAWCHGFELIFLSGRPDSCRTDTIGWLKRHVLDSGPARKPWALFMRETGDGRVDHQIKYEIFDERIRNNYRVHWAYDDRDQVVQMWREIGVDCFQVAPGAF